MIEAHAHFERRKEERHRCSSHQLGDRDPPVTIAIGNAPGNERYASPGCPRAAAVFRIVAELPAADTSESVTNTARALGIDIAGRGKIDQRGANTMVVAAIPLVAGLATAAIVATEGGGTGVISRTDRTIRQKLDTLTQRIAAEPVAAIFPTAAAVATETGRARDVRLTVIDNRLAYTQTLEPQDVTAPAHTALPTAQVVDAEAARTFGAVSTFVDHWIRDADTFEARNVAPSVFAATVAASRRDAETRSTVHIRGTRFDGRHCNANTFKRREIAHSVDARALTTAAVDAVPIGSGKRHIKAVGRTVTGAAATADRIAHTGVAATEAVFARFSATPAIDTEARRAIRPDVAYGARGQSRNTEPLEIRHVAAFIDATTRLAADSVHTGTVVAGIGNVEALFVEVADDRRIQREALTGSLAAQNGTALVPGTRRRATDPLDADAGEALVANST